MGNPFIIYSDEQKSPASARCPHREPQPASELPLRHTATRQQHTSDRRRMLDTFVEVVRRGMQEGVDEVTVTYNAPVPPRPGAEPQDDRGNSEDLPDLLPINDVWGPPDSDEDADEEDLIQEFGQPMDTSSDSPARRSMSEQAALERQAITDNPEWAFQRRRSRATAERSRASLADQSARAAHLEMLGLLRREWDRAREGSPQARAAGQPENLTSVRRVAREVLAQLDTRIESMTARQRERQPAVERPAPLGRQRDRPQEAGSSRGAMTWNSADVPSLFSPPRPAQGAVARERERDPFLTYEEMRERMRPLLGDNGVHLSPFLSRRSLLRGQDMGQSPADHVAAGGPSQPEMWSRTSGAAQLL